MKRRSPAKARPYHHGDLRRALIDAALQIIAADGEAACTLREVARRAGVSQAAPYRHFDDKRALFAAVAEEGFRLMTGEMERACAGVEHPGVRLLELGVAYVGFATAHPAHFRVMWDTSLHDPVAHPTLCRESERSYALLTEGVLACQRAQLVRAGDPVLIARFAWTVVHGLSALILGGQIPLARPVRAGALRAVAVPILELSFAGMSR